ncbi:MAG: insulinase family protein [Verrucomicrobia bacterium]|nr:insulinase family protein [Verrucomicrobiota bacterium]
MNFRKSFALVALVIALPCFVFAALPDKPRFGQETSDLQPEAAARFGTLPNGLRYVVMANKEPKDRASLRLVVMAGALHEADDQRGLAHFLEHMAFNGSTHYAPGTLVEFFQRMGMSFGGDTNAYTSFDHTAYMLELPDTKPATLDEGFRVFGDYADGLLLLDNELNRERGIILSEKRARDSVEYRQFVAEFDFVLAGTLLPLRMPIGLPAVIENAPRERFTDFYNTWYRPERMAVVVVGDFDPAIVEKQIVAAFSTIKPRSAARLAPDLGQIASFKSVRVTYHHEPEATSTAIAIQTVTPYADEPDTAAKRLEQLPRELAVAMLNRRLSILAKKEGAPFNAGKADISENFDFLRNASIDLTCKPELWRDALGVAEQELRRALQYGFQPAELAEAVANLRNSLDQAAKSASTRHSEELASGIIEALTEGSVFTSPADDQKLYAPALDKITLAQCADALRNAFAASGRFVTVMGNAKIGPSDVGAVPPPRDAQSAPSETTPEAQITTVYEKSLATTVAAPEQVAEAIFGYTHFGPDGTIKENKHVDDLDLTLITFANGVRLNLKKTDFEANKIHIAVRIGTGQLTEPKDKPGLSFFTNSTFTAGGLGQHSVDDLQRILAGKTVQVGFTVGSDALILGGFKPRELVPTNREDLLLQLQLLAAYVTDPGYRPESIRVAKKGFEQLYLRLDHTPNGPLQRDVPRLLASGDPRFGAPPQDALFARTLDESRAWLAPQLAQGPIEIAIVGDLDPDATIAAVAATFGALPPRAAKPALEAERKVSFPAAFAKDFAVQTEIPKGVVALYWPTTDGRDIRIVRRLNLLASVLSDRLRVKIREELGESYSPQAISNPSETYRDYGLLFTMVTIDPAKAEQIATATLAIADDLVKNGVNADELERAKKPVLTMLRESARANPYWLNAVLGSAQEFPQRLDWCRSRYSDNEGVTAAELSELAKKYLSSDHAFRVVVVPEKK